VAWEVAAVRIDLCQEAVEVLTDHPVKQVVVAAAQLERGPRGRMASDRGGGSE
jgi:hypothetical protein